VLREVRDQVLAGATRSSGAGGNPTLDLMRASHGCKARHRIFNRYTKRKLRSYYLNVTRDARSVGMYARHVDRQPDVPSSNRLAVGRRKVVRVAALSYYAWKKKNLSNESGGAADKWK
jgi:hypothetical protein